MKTMLGLLLAVVFLAVGFGMYPQVVSIMTDFYNNIALTVDPSMSAPTHALFNAGPLILLALIIFGAYQFFKGQRNKGVR
jgi:hypothetical protein